MEDVLEEDLDVVFVEVFLLEVVDLLEELDDFLLLEEEEEDEDEEVELDFFSAAFFLARSRGERVVKVGSAIPSPPYAPYPRLIAISGFAASQVLRMLVI